MGRCAEGGDEDEEDVFGSGECKVLTTRALLDGPGRI